MSKAHPIAMALGLAIFLSACRGAAPFMPDAQSPSITSRTSGVAAFVISDYFPKGNAKRAHYFPSETQALLIRIGRHQSQVQLTPLSPQCHLGTTSIKCIVKVTTSRGRSPYTVTALDAYDRRLSTASGNANVGAETNIPLTLHGIPAKLTVALEATPAVHQRSFVGLAISAYDADGALIVGSAPYDKPLRLGSSDKTGAFKPNTSTVAGPKTQVSLAYSGALADTTVSLRTDGGTPVKVTVYPALGVRTFHVGSNPFGGLFVVPGTLIRGTSGSMALAYNGGFTTISSSGSMVRHPSKLVINALTVGPDGNYWASRSKCDGPGACPTNWISKLDGKFQDYPVTAQVTSIVTGPNGNIWGLSQYPETVFEVDKSGNVTSFPVQGTSGIRLSNIVAASDGNLWFHDRGTIFGSERERFVLVAPDGSMTTLKAPNEDAPTLAPTPNEKVLWVAESGYGGVLEMTVSTETYRSFPGNPLAYGGNVIPMAADAKGDAWVQVPRPTGWTTAQPFIAFVRPDGSTAILQIPQSRDVTEITSLCFAADGTLWFATDTAVGTINI